MSEKHNRDFQEHLGYHGRLTEQLRNANVRPSPRWSHARADSQLPSDAHHRESWEPKPTALE